MAKKTRAKTQSSSPERVILSGEERAVALQELGLSPRDLTYTRPSWSYVVGAMVVVGSFAMAGRITQ